MLRGNRAVYYNHHDNEYQNVTSSNHYAMEAEMVFTFDSATYKNNDGHVGSTPTPMNMNWLDDPDLKNDDWFAYWNNWVSLSDSNWKKHATYNVALLFGAFDAMARRRLGMVDSAENGEGLESIDKPVEGAAGVLTKQEEAARRQLSELEVGPELFATLVDTGKSMDDVLNGVEEESSVLKSADFAARELRKKRMLEAAENIISVSNVAHSTDKKTVTVSLLIDDSKFEDALR